MAKAAETMADDRSASAPTFPKSRSASYREMIRPHCTDAKLSLQSRSSCGASYCHDLPMPH
jgi:hypothetical protein